MRSLIISIGVLWVVCYLTAPVLAQEDNESPPTYVVVSLGDSITRAFNSKDFLADAPEVSWSTGDAEHPQFNSHVLILRELFPDWIVRGFNYAVSGSVVAELDQQVNAALKLTPDYVTMMIGANDVCSWDDNHAAQLSAFETKTTQLLTRLTDSDPDLRVLLVPIPDIYHLWDIAHGRSSCQAVWDLTKMCKPLLHKSRNQTQRLEFRARWRDANAALSRAASAFPEQVLFPDNLADYSFGPDHISGYDCFHPSIKGQKLVAELTWREWWSFANESISSLYRR